MCKKQNSKTFSHNSEHLFKGRPLSMTPTIVIHKTLIQKWSWGIWSHGSVIVFGRTWSWRSRRASWKKHKKFPRNLKGICGRWSKRCWIRMSTRTERMIFCFHKNNNNIDVAWGKRLNFFFISTLIWCLSEIKLLKRLNNLKCCARNPYQPPNNSPIFVSHWKPSSKTHLIWHYLINCSIMIILLVLPN